MRCPTRLRRGSWRGYVGKRFGAQTPPACSTDRASDVGSSASRAAGSHEGEVPCGRAAAAAGDALKYVGVPFQLRENLFNRPAWHKLHKHEIDQHDPKQGWKDQGKSAQNICQHTPEASFVVKMRLRPSGAQRRPDRTTRNQESPAHRGAGCPDTGTYHNTRCCGCF